MAVDTFIISLFKQFFMTHTVNQNLLHDLLFQWNLSCHRTLNQVESQSVVRVRRATTTTKATLSSTCNCGMFSFSSLCLCGRRSKRCVGSLWLWRLFLGGTRGARMWTDCTANWLQSNASRRTYRPLFYSSRFANGAPKNLSVTALASVHPSCRTPF